MSQWQFLCHIRRKWVHVSEEEGDLLDAACSQRSAEYRLKNGVPMQVDFAAKDGHLKLEKPAAGWFAHLFFFLPHPALT